MKLPFKEIDLEPVLKRIWDWVSTIQNWNSFEGWAVRIIVVVGLLAILLWIVKHVLQTVVVIVESGKTLGIGFRKTPEEQTRLKRRRQFARVLVADLSTLAKSENWNDQFFTDLEAEVEAEGGYYASPLDRILDRKSRGLRRVPSLIEAIESSSEQCLLVSGEPGSGKSVALRHLAYQMAERASKSHIRDHQIPLYVNLKELPPPPDGFPTADFVRQFVLDNIRRGDADTAAYVRENWSLYRERGLWFFLFDSFDEIPAVLHAPTGSPVIQQYADAIRTFFEGMSECQGVLASREFKGPDSLPWNRFRILALNSSRQEELIDNAFLTPEQRNIVLQHVAQSESGFLTNPMFLTLLCRYVKQEQKAPINDHELLLTHLNYLANREPTYTMKKYGLSPDQLLESSVQLSVLFAKNARLSLAPTQDEIRNAIDGTILSVLDLENVLGALIDVKIGRCDVEEAKSGDRRFTFAHRRYQEAFFVQQLVSDPSYIPPEELLTDLRWRDYAVTLLQTGETAQIQPILLAAELLLSSYSCCFAPHSVAAEFGSHLKYYDWNTTLARDLLELLQEGLCRRLEEVPFSLRSQIKKFHTNVWKDGDSFDRLSVLCLGGLLPAEVLERRIRWAIEEGTVEHWDAAFAKYSFIVHISSDTAEWFRTQLADRLIFSADRADVLRTEAIAARLPPQIGAVFVVRRARKLRTVAQKLYPFVVRFGPEMVFRLLFRSSFTSPRIRTATLMQFYSLIVLFLVSFVPVFIFSKAPILVAAMGTSIILLTVIWILKHAVTMACRSVGEPLGIRSLWSYCRQGNQRSLKLFEFFFSGLAFAAGASLGTGAIIHLVAWLFGYRGSVRQFYQYGMFALLAVVVMSLAVSRWLRERRACKRLNGLYRNAISVGAMLKRAESWRELESWLVYDMGRLLPDYDTCRSLLRRIDEEIRMRRRSKMEKPFIKHDSISWSEYARLRRAVFIRLREFGTRE